MAGSGAATGPGMGSADTRAASAGRFRLRPLSSTQVWSEQHPQPFGRAEVRPVEHDSAYAVLSDPGDQ